MRYLFIIASLLISNMVNGQIGQAAAQIAIDIGTSTLPETETLVAINLHQQDVLKYSEEIAKKSAAIAVLKEAELVALNETPAGFSDTTPWKYSLGSIDAIVQLNSNTIQLINDFPDVDTLPITVTATILEKAYSGFSDIEAILQDGNNNLMSATDRYSLIEKLNTYLDKLESISRLMNVVVRNMILSSANVPTDYSYDITGSLENMLQNIDNLIIE